MTISYNEIPKNWRVPLVWCEIDPSRATQGAAAMPYRVLIMGHSRALVDGPQRITSASQAAKLFGADSLLAAQAAAWFKANSTTEVYFLAVPEPQGQAAGLTLTFSGTAEAGGDIPLYVGGRRHTAYVAPGATAREAAEALYLVLSGDQLWPVTLADNDEPTLTVKAPHAGEYANGVMVRAGYYQGEGLPAGLMVAYDDGAAAGGSPTPDYEVSAALAGVVAYNGEADPARPFHGLPIPGMLEPRAGAYGRLAGGSGAPALTAVLAALGDTQYHLIVTPWVDDASLASLKALATERWHGLAEIPAQVIAAAGGTTSTLGAMGDSHNSQHLTVMGTGGPFTAQENNLLLYDGISTWQTTGDGGCAIQRLITTYKTNAWGAEDTAYLDLNTPLTLSYLRRSYKVWMAKVFPRHKLCGNDANFGYGQALVTPDMIKGETLAWFNAMELLGLVENVDQFRRDLIVDRNPDDPCRVDILLPPDLVNQLRVMAIKLAFAL